MLHDITTADLNNSQSEWWQSAGRRSALNSSTIARCFGQCTM